VGQGADGFSIYTPNLKDIWPFAERAVSERTLRLVDDLWISAFLQRQGVKVKSLRDQLPPKQTIYEVAHTINQLQNLEGDLEREKVMAAGTRYLIASGMMGRRMQWVGIAKNLVRRVKTTISGRS
jgi:hypothetical protein